MSQYAVFICHTIFVSFWIIFHVPACCSYGHCFRRQMLVGELGSPEKRFVDSRYADLFSVNGKVLILKQEYKNLHYTTLFPFFQNHIWQPSSFAVNHQGIKYLTRYVQHIKILLLFIKTMQIKQYFRFMGRRLVFTLSVKI